MDISFFELRQMMADVAEQSAQRIVEKLGIVSSTYKRADIVRLYSVTIFNKSQHFVKWHKKGGGQTSPVVCNKAEFDLWLSKMNCEAKELKTKPKTTK